MEDLLSSIILKFIAKGGIYALLSLGCLFFGILIFIHRKFSYPIEKYQKLNKLKTYLNKFHINPKEILPEADYTYLKTDLKALNCQKINDKLEKQFLPGVKIEEKYIINSTLILLLEFVYTDFDLGISGNLENLEKKRLMFGKFEINQKNNSLIFQGEVYMDRFDKQRIENFVRALEL